MNKYTPKNPLRNIEISEKVWIALFLIFYISLFLVVCYLFMRGIIIHPY